MCCNSLHQSIFYLAVFLVLLVSFEFQFVATSGIVGIRIGEEKKENDGGEEANNYNNTVNSISNNSEQHEATSRGNTAARGLLTDCDNYKGEEELALLPGFEVVYPIMTRKAGVRPINTYNGQNQKMEDCYYQGYCSRKGHTKKENVVSVSTCDGLRGVIQIDGESYTIYPHENSNSEMLCRPHLIYKMASSTDGSCANQSGQWMPFDMLHKTAFYKKMEEPLKSSHRRVRRNAEPAYLELALVIDSTLYEMFGNSEDRATDFTLQVTNIIDMYYQSLRIRVGLVYSEFWTEDRVSISANPRETLQNFLTYAENDLNHVSYDLVHLISGRIFDGNTSGLAVPDSVCTKRGMAVISTQSGDNTRHTASVISHMIGHNIGLHHDTEDCECEDEISGCIMSSNIGSKSPTKFSSCSRSRMEIMTQSGLGSCLVEEPEDNPYPQSCGNGFVERGEQCDCGLASNCEKVDPCCDASTCLLKFWAVCQSGPCCHNCLPKQSTEVCRQAKGECDSTEYCDGVSGECPVNSLIADGQPCSEGYCYQGRCPSRNSQCKQFWGLEAINAHDECYTLQNPSGNRLGHCGLDGEGGYIKCDARNSLCGLLQCEGGTDHPGLDQLEYGTVSTGENGNRRFTCKTIAIRLTGDLADIGLVADGAWCGEDSVCINRQCVSSMAAFGRAATCPVGGNNRTCSGNGRCTDIQTCSCNDGYRGALCDEVLPTSSFRGTTVLSSSPGNSGGSTLSTKWLIVIICLVAVAVVLAAVFAFLFCRKQVVSPLRKKPKKKKQLSHLSGSGELEKDRTISFGLTPSYRNEKDGKRKRRKKRRPSSSGEDETDSDDRNAGGIRVDVVIPEELSRQPERGILKKSTSSAFEGIEKDDCCHSQCSCSDSGSCSCSDGEQSNHQGDIPVSSNEGAGQEIPPPLEFDTNMYEKNFEINVQVEVNSCQEISPTDSEDMKYCATEADQFYGNFPSSGYDSRYASVNPALLVQSGGDSATDSAIDMPGDGSVSTINEIPPHHSTAILSNSSYKHTPTIADYSELQSDSSNDRSRVYRPPRYASKPVTPSLLGQGHLSDLHPVIYEYNRPPTNRSLTDRGRYDIGDGSYLQAGGNNGSRESPQYHHRPPSHHQNRKRHDSGSSTRADDSITV